MAASKKSLGLLALVFALATLLVQLPTHEAKADGEAAKLAACPVSLTNPDGQALSLEKYDLKVAVHGPLSMTEMEMVFKNPENRQMEGRFLYMLPPGSTVSRFAKEVNGHLMEGEVVETQRARAVYREILHSMRDPALMEFDQGDRFSVKVFPIPANGTVRLVLSFSQLLPIKDGKRHLTIPMTGLPQIKDFSFNAYVQGWPGESPSLSPGLEKFTPKENGVYSTSCKAENYLAQNDIELTITPDLKDIVGQVRALKAGNVQMLSYMPKSNVQPVNVDPLTQEWHLFIDTSASNLDSEMRRLQALDAISKELRLVERIGQKVPPLKVTAFDVEIAPLFGGFTAGAGDQSMGAMGNPLVRMLKARHALGATDLGLALRTIGEAARANPNAKYVLVSDGIPTWGAREVRDVVAQLGDWPTNASLNVLVLGNKQDSRMLEAITEKANGRIVQYPFNGKFEAEAKKAVSELLQPMGQNFEFYDEAADWIYPKKFHDVRAGQELLVFSSLKNGAESKPGVTHLADRISATETPKFIDDVLKPEAKESVMFEPLLKRESGSAYIHNLELQEQGTSDAKKNAELRKQRVEASVKYRVLTPLTSLLVLETENDYARFRIDRNALAEVLAVTSTGIQIAQRDPAAIGPGARKAEKAVADNRKFKGEAKKQSEQLEKDAAGKEADRGELAKEEKLDDGKPGDAFGGAESKDAVALDGLIGGQGGGRGRGGEGGGSNADRALARAGETRADESRREVAATGAAPFAGTPAEAQTVAPGQQPPAPVVRTPVPEAPVINLLQNGERQNNAQSDKQLKMTMPEWVISGGKAPTEAELSALRAKVAAEPMNLALRNTAAEALKSAKQWDTLQSFVMEWLPFDPENPQAFEFLANSAAGIGDMSTAFRAATSIAEVSPKNAALLQRAGWIMLVAKKYDLAIALFTRSLEERKDDPNTYRGLALTQWLKGNFSGALKTYQSALAQDFHNRYGDVKRVFKEEADYVWRAYVAEAKLEDHNEGTDEVAKLSHSLNVNGLKADALRVSLGWETDANDVDLHVVDPSGEECFYSHNKNASGLELYSDQTQGLGPEVIRTAKVLKGEYHIGVTYFNAGPMGVSRGVVVVMQPDEKGVVKEPSILPFCLLPNAQGGKDIRYVMRVDF